MSAAAVMNAVMNEVPVDEEPTLEQVYALIDAASDEEIDAEMSQATVDELREIAREQTLPVRLLTWIAHHCTDADVLAIVAANPTTDAPTVWHLTTSEHLHVRFAAGRHRNLGAQRARHLAATGDRHVRGGVAANPLTPADVLTQLAVDPAMAIFLCTNPAAPASVLAHLATSSDPQVRCGVAGHQATPRWVLRIMAMDHDPNVRRIVAANRRTPADVLTAFTACTHSDDLRAVAYRNPSTPLPVKARVLGTEKFGADVRAGISDEDVHALIIDEATTVKQKALGMRLLIKRGPHQQVPLDAFTVLAPYRAHHDTAVRKALSIIVAEMLN